MFIEFTLSALFDTVVQQEKHQDKYRVELGDAAMSVLTSLEEKPLSRKELFVAIQLNGDSRAFKRHIAPLLAEDLIEMTVPEKPNSRLQKYRITQKGVAVIKNEE